jgi:class 3 adenylate cyclase
VLTIYFTMKSIKQSIGLKIFSVVILIVVVMVGVSVVNVKLESRVGQALDRVSNRYLVAYGSLARANLRSVEQALEVRGLVISILMLKSEDLQKNAGEQIAIKGKQFWEETALFHEMIAMEMKEKFPLVDVTLLARLDEKVNAIEESQKQYEKELQRATEELKSGNLNYLNDNISRLESSRKDYNETLDNTRRLMLTATRDASAKVVKLQERLHRISIILVLLATILAISLAAYITKNIVKPVRVLLKGTNSVIGGSLEMSLPVTSSDEIGNLTTAFNSMTGELRKADLVRDMFGKYVDPRIVKDLINQQQFNTGKGERQVMTILFCDMRGFTDLSEGLMPDTLVTILNRYFTLMSEAVHENEGVIDKFIGDAVMAYWGMPFNPDNKQAQLAAQAAIEMFEKLNIFLGEMPELMGIRRNLPEIAIRIGIATGEVVVGNIGSEKTKNFTVIGDTVNLASRLESANKAYGTRVLITEETSVLLNSSIVTREIDTIQVPGKQEAKKVFEIMGMRGMMTPALLELKERYEEGLAAYYGRDWEKARKAFRRCLEIKAGDGPSVTFLKRTDHFESNPPDPGWNGTWVITQK